MPPARNSGGTWNAAGMPIARKSAPQTIFTKSSKMSTTA